MDRIIEPYCVRKSLELGILKTFSIPSIAKTLYSTDQFTKHCARREQDTSLFLEEISDEPEQSERFQTAVKRMNFIHAQYRISNNDYLYTLAVFVFEPIEFINNFGGRCVGRNVEIAYYHFFKQVGIKMGIKEIPKTFDAFKQWRDEYEETYMVYDGKYQTHLAESITDLYFHLFPAVLRPYLGFLVSMGNHLIDPRLSKAVGWPEQHAFGSFLAHGILTIRSILVEYVFPPRFHCNNKKSISDQVAKDGTLKYLWYNYKNEYPNGFKISELGGHLEKGRLGEIHKE